MKQLNPNFYVIVPKVYAERRAGDWYVTDEASKIVAGPFDSPEAARDHVEGEAAQVETSPSTVGPPVVVPKPAPPADDDLITLRQASMRLPVSYQALYQARSRGSLPAPVRTEPSRSTKSGTVDLYSFTELAALYEGKTTSERISEGARRRWAKRREASA